MLIGYSTGDLVLFNIQSGLEQGYYDKPSGKSFVLRYAHLGCCCVYLFHTHCESFKLLNFGESICLEYQEIENEDRHQAQSLCFHEAATLHVFPSFDGNVFLKRIPTSGGQLCADLWNDLRDKIQLYAAGHIYFEKKLSVD